MHLLLKLKIITTMKNFLNYKRKSKTSSLFFYNFVGGNALLRKIAGDGILKVLILILFMGIFVSANAQNNNFKRFDLAFGEVNPTDECDLKKMDVNIVNVNEDTAKFEVVNLNVLIKYLGNATIDQEKTTNGLNDKLEMYYHGYNNGAIVTYPDNEIWIRAYANSSYERQKFKEIFDLIKIYFSGEPDEQVNFYFEYDNPKSYINLFDWNNTLDYYYCTPKRGGSGYNITQSYTFGATSDYDLGFIGGVSEPGDDCDFVRLDVGVTNYNGADNWNVKKFKFYIDYDNYNNIDIDDETEKSLDGELTTKYEGITDPNHIVTFSPGRIAIEGKLKEGFQPTSLFQFHQLITVYFTGTPLELFTSLFLMILLKVGVF